MSTPDLHRQISALSETLAKTASVDQGTRALLAKLQIQIEHVAGSAEHSVTERLEAIAVRFETDHPTAGTALRQAIDALVKAGI